MCTELKIRFDSEGEAYFSRIGIYMRVPIWMHYYELITVIEEIEWKE